MKALFTFLAFLLTASRLYSQPQPANILWEKITSAYTIKFSPNGQFLATGGGVNSCYPYSCGKIEYWRVADSTKLETITGPQVGFTNEVDFSPDGTKLVSAHGSVYCAPNGGCTQDKTGQYSWSFPGGTNQYTETNIYGIVEAIDYSPNGQLIAIGKRYDNLGEIVIYNASDFTVVRTLEGHQYVTASVKFSPDGQYLASGGDDGKLRIWRVSDGQLIRTLDHGTYFEGGIDVEVAYSPNGQYIVSAGQGYLPAVKVWRAADGVLLHNFTVHPDDGYVMAEFTPNNAYVAAGLTIYEQGTGWHGRIKFWDVATGQLVIDYIDVTNSPQGGGIRAIAFSNTANNLFAYAVSNRLRVAGTTLSLVSPTSISGNTEIPSEYSLAQNYPNPFNPETTIRYSIPENVFVSLSLYDISGRMVRTMVNTQQTPGSYTINVNGSALSSGVYYYRLNAGSFTETKKMLLVK